MGVAGTDGNKKAKILTEITAAKDPIHNLKDVFGLKFPHHNSIISPNALLCVNFFKNCHKTKNLHRRTMEEKLL